MKRLLSILIIFVFIAMAFVVVVGNNSTETTNNSTTTPTEGSTRLDFEVTTFNNDLEDSTIVFNSGGGGSVVNRNFELPGGSLIQSATMDVEGRPFYTAASTFTTKDYTDRANNMAFWGRNTTSDLPPKQSPENVVGWSTEFTSTNYNSIDGNDSSEVYHTASGTYSGNPAYHMYKVRVDKSQTSHMIIKWRGTAQHASYTYYEQTAHLAVYSESAKAWQQAAKVKCTGSHATTYEMTLDINRDFLVSDTLYFIVWGEESQYGYGYYQSITSRYVEVKAYDRQPNYPTNPGIDLNNDGSSEWTATGALSSKSTFSGLNFQNTLQTLVNGKTDTVEIPLKFSAQSMGILYLSNISIKYKLNAAPVVKIIPSPIQVLEDVGVYNTGIKLDAFITDDMGFDLLTLDTIGGGPDTVDVSFNDDKIMIITPADDFYGEVEVVVTATDWGLNDVDEDGAGDDVTVSSDTVYIQVLPTDDPPTILDINQKEPISVINRVEFTGTEKIYEDSTYTMFVNATDIDGDEVTLSTNVSNGRFKLEETDDDEMWKITFTPDYRDIGKKWFEIKATEKNNSVSTAGVATVDLIIEVENVNDNPVIKHFDVEDDKKYTHSGSTTEITVLEDTSVNITMKIFDEDGDYVVLDSNFTNMRFDLDTIDGKIKFTPIQEDVGTHWIGFTLEDDTGGFTEATLKLIVENVNDKPTNVGFDLVGDSSNPLNITLTAKEGFDQDGDELIYKWNFCDKVTGTGIVGYHDYLEPKETKTYTVTLIVSDGIADSPTETKDYTIEVAEGGGIVVTGPQYTEPTEDWIENGDDRYDTDSDGLPNWWEQMMEMDMNDPNDPGIEEMKVEYRDELNNYEAWKKDQETVNVDPDDEDINTSDGKSSTAIEEVVIIAVILVLIAIVAIVLLLVGKKKKQAEEEEEAKKNAPEAKMAAAYSNLYGAPAPQSQTAGAATPYQQQPGQVQPAQQMAPVQQQPVQQMPTQDQQQMLPPGQA